MNNIKKEAKAMMAEIEDKYQSLFAASPVTRSQVDEDIINWQKSTQRHFDVEYPYYEDEQLYLSILDSTSELANIKQQIGNYKVLCFRSKTRFNKFWEQELAKLVSTVEVDALTEEMKRDLQSTHSLLRNEWRKLLDKLRTQWELEQVSKLRERFLKELFEKLNALLELLQAVETLGLEPGAFFDLSSGSLSLHDIGPIKRWLEYLKNDQGVKDLLEMMGRINQAKQSEKIEIVQKLVCEKIPVPDINSKEEIVGIRLGKDIEHALPSELALMADPETSLLFDLKYIESGLLCFDMEGIQHIDNEYEVEVEHSVTEGDNKGPMIICVDTSGSMQGAPETIAKAITMLMVLKAKQDNRACYLINFSTNIETLDLSSGFALDNLISFLQKSFHGGTDVAPAIEQGVSVMETDEYENADMLIISDFIMAGLPTPLLNKIEKLREGGNKFNSLVVDSCFMEHRLKTIFDHEWVYDPDTSQVVELLGFERKMLN
ncbi:hypothetical protein NBRC116592_32240 [Colwellia sp. KU-HH00111]|uniref:VWA domain-containing protein n=1 Tax=Colwellia sp. KU-HH00111 TaxID=3127652 RepID=UPI00310A043A